MNGFTAQALAAVCANLVMVSGGMLFAWSSPSLSKYVSDDADLPLTSGEFGWLASFLSLGSIFGPLLAFQAVDMFGRKWSLYLAALFELISWVMIGLAGSYEVLCAARFIGGLGLGASYSTMPMYIGEMCEDRFRGGLGTLLNVQVNMGFVLTFSIGPWVSTWMLALISAIPVLLFSVTFFWMPETPYYLIMKGKGDAARASLAWFRGKNDVEEELKKIEYSVRLDQQNKTSIQELVTNLGNRRALIVMAVLLSAQQCSGLGAIQAYASEVIAQSGLGFSSDVSVIFTGITKLSAGLAIVFIVDFSGRRPILLLSAIGTTISLATEAVYYNLKDYGFDLSNVSWVPLVGIIGYYLTLTIGLTNLPYAILGELFPTNVKARATMVCAMYANTLGFVVTKLYQVLKDAYDVYVPFYGFAVCVFVCSILICILVPETKRCTLQEIQDKLNRRRRPASLIPKDANETDGYM